MLLLLPGVFVVGKYFLNARVICIVSRCKIYWLSRVALRKIDAATQRSNGYELLQIMRNLVHRMYNVPHDVSEDLLVTQYLLAHHYEPGLVHDWQTLWRDLQKAAFDHRANAQRYELLGSRCCEWVKRLSSLQE
jgi:hypothetical protein